MSFLSDLGNFLGDVQEFSEQLDTVKQEVASSVIGAVTQVQQATDDTTADLAENSAMVQSTTSEAVDSVKQSFSND